VCNGTTENYLQCDMGSPGSCVDVGGGSATCLPGTIATCTGTSLTCNGNVGVFCFNGIEETFDCGSAGQTCMTNGCRDGTACDFQHTDACTGNTLSVCASGNEHNVDCAAMGGTCGTLSSGRAGCVFP
jgi:hypothetical protein